MMNKVRENPGNGRYRIASMIGLLLFAGCQAGSGQQEAPVSIEDRPLATTEPMERDLADIRESGVLRMLTPYSSHTYFLREGMEAGFEYELLHSFAREHDLALEVVIIGPEDSPFDLLNQGAGDVIAAHYAVTPERKGYAAFTRPYNLVDQHLVFSADLPAIPETMEELAEMGIPVAVTRNSSYYQRLLELRDQGLDIEIQLVSGELDTEAMLFQLSYGDLKATVADDNLLQSTAYYLDGLVKGPLIAESDSIAWVTRRNSPDLTTAMNRFLYRHFRFTDDRDEPRRSEFLNILRKRYFGDNNQLAGYFDSGLFNVQTQAISPYDKIIREVADSLDLDWLLLTAVMAQESRFNPHAKSWAGAVGLMQIMPRFSEIEYQQLYDPAINIREGARILRENLAHYDYLDRENQWAFALATYNAGVGHMADARRLAMDRNRNPNEWESVADALLKLMQRQYYQNARFGYVRGIETVQFVHEIMNRYEMYQRVLLAASERNQTIGPGILGVSTVIR
ncbi:MAG: transglycosylase SLT domain-containing protein [Balneolaceae bacterium]